MFESRRIGLGSAFNLTRISDLKIRDEGVKEIEAVQFILWRDLVLKWKS